MAALEQSKPAQGMRAFFTIWFAQLVSLVGSQLTGFAMGVWVYDQTHSVLLLALVQVAQQAPYVVLSPIAGVFADRWNRRTSMIVSDFGAGLAVLVAAIMYLTHTLQPSFHTLMWPSFTAATTLLVPKQHFGRVNGFVQLGEALPQIAGPALAGMLYVTIHMGNMALIDFVSYAFSVLLLLLFVRIPNPERSIEDMGEKRSVWKEMSFGWNYITARKGLLALLIFFMVSNFLSGVMSPLIVPLILDNWDASTLGYISTLMGVGMLIGTLVMSAWGGGKRKIYTLLGAALLANLFLCAVGLRASLVLIAVCGVAIMFFSPFTNACSQAIWQAKVAPDLQGRVFAFRRAIAWSVNIISPLLAAPLADYIFKPSMAAGGALTPLLGPIFGVGASRGIGVLISLVGILSVIAAIIALFIPLIRRVELDLPDYDQAVTAPAAQNASENSQVE
jgi:DHA3 family macrolide efflux protein-like MFS transporter